MVRRACVALAIDYDKARSTFASLSSLIVELVLTTERNASLVSGFVGCANRALTTDVVDSVKIGNTETETC